jgi:hypothetical protein
MKKPEMKEKVQKLHRMHFACYVFYKESMHEYRFCVEPKVLSGRQEGGWVSGLIHLLRAFISFIPFAFVGFGFGKEKLYHQNDDIDGDTELDCMLERKAERHIICCLFVLA